MNIKLIKLVTGEEVVAEVKDDKAGYTLNKPAKIIITEEGLGLMPLSIFAKETKEVKIAANHVIWSTDPEDQIANAYNSQFGSGIVLPPRDLV